MTEKSRSMSSVTGEIAHNPGCFNVTPNESQGVSRSRFVKILLILITSLIVGTSLIFLLLQERTGSPMEKDFCTAMIENDRMALKQLVDEKLDSLSALTDQEYFQQIQSWIESHECVSSVEMTPGVLRSDPPIKEFIVTVQSDQTGHLVRSIGIQLFPGKPRFNYK